MCGNYWTPKQIAQLRAQAGEVPLAEIALRLGRSPAAVRVKAGLLGLSLRTRAGSYLSAGACHAPRADVEQGLAGADDSA
jgi:hypothetical protein